MAKALAYRRSAQQVVTLDTINNRVDPLGAVLPTVEATSLFPNRSTNLIAVYRGDPYFLYKNNVGNIQLDVYTGGVWTNVAGFGSVAPTGGSAITPIGLFVEQGFLVAIMQQSGAAGFSGTRARRSANGTVWDPVIGPLLTPTQPSTSNGGHAIVWRNAVFFATVGGIAFYRPATNTLSAVFDTGSDGGLQASGTQSGRFAFWNNDLYFAKFESVPVIYKLASSFDPAAPPAPPAWTKIAATGIPNVGLVSVTPDSGSLLLFVNKQDRLCLLYSGQLSTKLLQTSAATFPAFSDVTASFLASDLVGATDLGFTLYTDDRRRVNELQSILVYDLAAGDTLLMTWDGLTVMAVRTTFAGVVLMAPNERFGALRTFTDVQPTAHITAVAQPFPGRMSISYTVREAASRPVDVFGEYSIDGDVWSPMTQGDGDSGSEQLASTPAGSAYTFHWDAYVDLDGDYPAVHMRIVARISGV